MRRKLPSGPQLSSCLPGRCYRLTPVPRGALAATADPSLDRQGIAETAGVHGKGTRREASGSEHTKAMREKGALNPGWELELSWGHWRPTGHLAVTSASGDQRAANQEPQLPSGHSECLGRRRGQGL